MNYGNLNENSPTITQPDGINIKLHPHQLTSIAAMINFEKNASVIVDKPNTTSGIYRLVINKFNNNKKQFVSSTFVIETNTAILADKVGSGKTYMILGLILHTQSPRPCNRIVLGTDNFFIRTMNNVEESVKTNLIVTPHNLTNQWGEFTKNTTTLKCLVLSSLSDFDIFFDIEETTTKTGTYGEPFTLFKATKKKQKVATQKNSKTSKKTKQTFKSVTIYQKKTLNVQKVQQVLAETDVIILNINRYNKPFNKIFTNIKWSRVIIDEMDTIHIPNVFFEHGNFQWFITATPMSIFTRSCKKYVGSIFGNYYDLLPYFTVRNNNSYIDQSIVLPQPFAYMIKCRMHRVASQLRDIIPRNVLQLVNAGNVREAITELNCDVETEDTIFNVLTEKTKAQLHNLEAKLSYVQALIPVDEEAHKERIKDLKDSIQSCKTRIDTIDERIKSIKTECCLICADNFQTPVITDCCKAVFCLKCLLSSHTSLGKKCPMCRADMKSNKSYRVVIEKPTKESHDNKDILFETIDKTDALELLLKEIKKTDATPRILIFSDYAQTLSKIVKHIAKAKLRYNTISGTPSHISTTIDEYNEGKINVLFLNSSHYGSGLNLQSTKYLILFHRMDNELETQVLGRAHRFGRQEPLHVIYLLHENERTSTSITTSPLTLNYSSDLKQLSNNSKTSVVSTSTKVENKPKMKKRSKLVSKPLILEDDN